MVSGTLIFKAAPFSFWLFFYLNVPPIFLNNGGFSDKCPLLKQMALKYYAFPPKYIKQCKIGGGILE